MGGKTVLNTLMIQTKLKGVNAEAIKNVLEASQTQNQNGLDNFEKQAVAEKAACAADAKTLKANLQEAVSKRYTLEKHGESSSLLKERKADYAKSLEAEVGGYTAFLGDIKKGQEAWTAFYDSGLLGTAVQNAVQLATYARNVLEARAAICADFARTYFNHVRRYNSVRLPIAELSNTFDEEYKDFESFLQKKMSESQ